SYSIQLALSLRRECTVKHDKRSSTSPHAIDLPTIPAIRLKDSHRTDSMQSTHKIASFSQLPAEIYLIILAYTPIKGILRCRLLNRNLKSIVDNEKNRELLAKQPNRGLQPDPNDRMEDAKAFASHRVGSNLRDVDDIGWLAHELIERHVQRHLPHILNYHPIDDATFLSPSRHSALQYLNISEEELLAMFARVRATQTPGGILQGTVHTRKRRDVNGFPRFPLTPLRFCSSPISSRNVRFQGFCTVLELVDLFDVPDLGDAGDLAYFIERAWVYEKVQQVVFGARLSLVEKAAVLEEIWVY
ncbi:hypothetical protein HII31_08669, partial [Pseudocercospora fuligena]